MLMRIVLALILVCCAGQSVEGQRFLRTLHPPERPEGEELKFDTNLLPLTNSTISISGTSDANYAPNLVFTPDSNRFFAFFRNSSYVMILSKPTLECRNLTKCSLFVH